MAKGGASKDKKPAEKKGGDKGKGKPEEAADKGGKVRKHTGLFLLPWCRSEGSFQGKAGLKAATAVNVRHILCEKHSKAMEALQRIQARHAIHVSCRGFLILYYRATRPESDSTKLLRNVRRTRPKVYRFVISSGYHISYSTRVACKPVVVWVGWFADRWWYASTLSISSGQNNHL